jgi:hypothetical protein
MQKTGNIGNPGKPIRQAAERSSGGNSVARRHVVGVVFQRRSGYELEAEKRTWLQGVLV